MRSSTKELLQIPEEAFLRLPQVLRLIPVSRSTWWSWVKAYKAPQPIKLGGKVTVWKAADIYRFIDEQSGVNGGEAA